MVVAYSFTIKYYASFENEELSVPPRQEEGGLFPAMHGKNGARLPVVCGCLKIEDGSISAYIQFISAVMVLVVTNKSRAVKLAIVASNKMNHRHHNLHV